MATFNSRLLTPPSEEEEIQLYRDVWRSLAFQYGGYFLLTALLYLAINIFRPGIPENARFILSIGVVFLPVLFWFVFTYLVERQMPQPRRQLLPVLVVSALVANGVAYPFIEGFLQVDQWLSLAPAVQRILGYTFTVGIVQEMLKYLVVRSLVWDDHLRIRDDTIAYADTAALGFVTVLGLHFISAGTPPLDAVAARMFSLLAIHVVSSCIVAYGLAETRFADSSPLLLPLTLALAWIVTGLAIPLRAGLVNASISPAALEFALPRPLFGIGFSLALFGAGMFLVLFLFRNAERRDREISLGRDT